MRPLARLLILFSPIVFLLGLWLGLNKPGWAPSSWNQPSASLTVLCPAGVFSAELLEALAEKEGLLLTVSQMDSNETYFRLLYKNLKDFDVVCVMSHHLSQTTLEDQFDRLPVSAEWRSRQLHIDFQSLPMDPGLHRFWPLGYQLFLPAILTAQLEIWPHQQKEFDLYLEEDFRELLHLYIGRNLLRSDWLFPENTDPLTATLKKSTPAWHKVSRENLLELMGGHETSERRLLYLSHTFWNSAPPNLKEHWTWGLDDLPGNLQILGLAQPRGAKNPAHFDQLLRALAQPELHKVFVSKSNWASPLSQFQGSSFAGPELLRHVPLTHFQVVTGLDPSAIFWERIVESSPSGKTSEEETL